MKRLIRRFNKPLQGAPWGMMHHESACGPKTDSMAGRQVHGTQIVRLQGGIFVLPALHLCGDFSTEPAGKRGFLKVLPVERTHFLDLEGPRCSVAYGEPHVHFGSRLNPQDIDLRDEPENLRLFPTGQFPDNRSPTRAGSWLKVFENVCYGTIKRRFPFQLLKIFLDLFDRVGLLGRARYTS